MSFKENSCPTFLEFELTGHGSVQSLYITKLLILSTFPWNADNVGQRMSEIFCHVYREWIAEGGDGDFSAEGGLGRRRHYRKHKKMTGRAGREPDIHPELTAGQVQLAPLHSHHSDSIFYNCYNTEMNC